MEKVSKNKMEETSDQKCLNIFADMCVYVFNRCLGMHWVRIYISLHDSPNENKYANTNTLFARKKASEYDRIRRKLSTCLRDCDMNLTQHKKRW